MEREELSKRPRGAYGTHGADRVSLKTVLPLVVISSD